MASIEYENTLRLILDPLDESPTECDGFVRLAQAVLSKYSISHKVMRGTVTAPYGEIGLHFWIEAGGFFVDYRARMWLGEQAPHGIFRYSDCVYEGEEVSMGQTDPFLFMVLAGRSISHY